MIKLISTAVFGVALFALSFSQPALSQDGAQGVLEACEPEIKELCENVNPGEGRLFACLYSYEDRVSPQCANAFDDFADAIDFLFANANEALSICAPDIQAQCSDTTVGGGRILTCLSENKGSVSSDCQAQIEVFENRFGLN